MSGEIERAVQWAVNIANDDTHRYCLGDALGAALRLFAISLSTAYGSKAEMFRLNREGGASYTQDDMYKRVFTSCGFEGRYELKCNLSKPVAGMVKRRRAFNPRSPVPRSRRTRRRIRL